MSVALVVAGTSYTYPSVGDTAWGAQATAWAQAVSASMLQTSGGIFFLTADANFGTSFGLISKYFTSVAANSASAGALRLANLDYIKWRNAANNADLGLQLDASNIFQLGSALTVTGNFVTTGTVTATNFSGSNTGDVTLTAVGSTPSANGASLSAQALTLQPADGSNPGLLTSGTQTIGGAKTFSTSAISAAFISSTSNPSATGIFRLANADGIGWRNSGNSADFLLKPDANGILQYNSIDLVNLSATQTLTNKTIAAASNTISGLTNSNLSGTAGITGANIAAATLTNSLLATMAANTVKANVTGGSASPTDVALVSAATASAAMIRDASANVRANNFIEGYATTATAAGTTTLTVASAFTQLFTGVTTQTCVLPDCTTLVLGQQFYVVNRSTGVVTVNASGGTLVQSMATNTSVYLTCTNIGSAAGAWDVSSTANAALSNPMTTGGDLIYGGASGVPTRLANGSSGQFLKSAGGTSAHIWSTPSMFNYTAQSTTYAAVINDYILASGASFTITLPTAVGQAGRAIGIKHGGTSLTQVYTLQTTSSQTIDGIAGGSYALYTNSESIVVVSDGANWEIVSRFSKTPWTSATALVVGAVTTAPTQPTMTTDTSFWMRDGKNMIWTVTKIGAGSGSPANGSGTYKLPLPASQSIDTTFYSPSTTAPRSIVDGIGRIGGAAAGADTLVYFFVFDSTNLAMITATTNTAPYGSGSTPYTNTFGMTFTVTVPIANWQP